MKVKRNVSIDKDILEWVLKQIKTRKFSSVSHAVNLALYELRERETKKKPNNPPPTKF